MKLITLPGSMHNTGCLGLVHWDDPEGWCQEGDGREVPEGGEICIPMADSWIHVDVWQKPTKFCKAVIFQLKNK